MFRNLSSTVTKEAVDGAVEVFKTIYPKCSNDFAWDIANLALYTDCSQEISASSPQIFSILDDIEQVAKQTGYSAYDIWMSLEASDPNQDHLDNSKLNLAITKIKEMSAQNSESNTQASCEQDCLMAMRDIIIQLKLIQLGYYGPAEATAGLYLAYHRKKIGSYFTNSLNNQWPYYPLHSEPTDLEKTLNNHMEELTEKMSNGKLKNISIMDLPGFGSALSDLGDHQANLQANWPNELNFAMYNKDRLAFSQFKTLLYHWHQHMSNVSGSGVDSDPLFPPNSFENQFNYSVHIAEDFSTFLTSYIGSYPTAMKESLPVWLDTARKVFHKTLNKQTIEKNGLYDRVIMDCSFQGALMDKDADLSGGCQYFDKTLTNKGLCHSFNGLAPSSLWKSSKLIATLEKNFDINHSHYKFSGTGSNQGKKKVISKSFNRH